MNPKKCKVVNINGTPMIALIDNGSDVSLLREDVLLKVGILELSAEKRTLYGIGKKAIVTLGNVSAEIEADGIKLENIFHVHRVDDIPYSVVLGNDILDFTDVHLSRNGSRFLKIEGEIGKNSTSQGIESVLHKEYEALCLTVDTESGTGDLESKLVLLPNERPQEIIELVEDSKPIRTDTHPVSMKIILSDEIPIYDRARRISHADQAYVDDQIKCWLEEGIIKPSTSEFAAPIVLIQKKDDTERICCDYHKLNKKIMRDNFPTPGMEDVIDRLQKANIFIAFDLKNDFLHVPVEPESRKYTAFTNKVIFQPIKHRKELKGMYHYVVRDEQLAGWPSCRIEL